MERFDINEIVRNNNPDFELEKILYSVSYPDNFQTFEQSLEQIETMLRVLHLRFTSDMRSSDKIRVAFFHSGFFTCIDIPFVRRDQFTPDLLIETFENVIQSYKFLVVNGNNEFSANVQIQRMPSGRGRRFIYDKQPPKKKKRTIELNNNISEACLLPNIQDICLNKNSVINIFNDDNMCCLRAILIGIRYCENYPDKANYSKPNSAHLLRDIEYFKNTLNLPNDGCGIAEVQQIEAFIENYCITIIDGTTIKSNKFLYKGPKNKKFLYLLYTNSHFNVITSMPAFLGTSYYCNFCNIGYSNIQQNQFSIFKKKSLPIVKVMSIY